MDATFRETEQVGPVRVERWPTELPLLLFVAVAAAGVWVFAAISLIGMFYAVLIGAFFLLTHVAFVANLRGSAVRLGPDQFPELHRRVLELAARAGLRECPEAYIMQAGGSLNAVATKFLRSNMVVLFSDLLEACGDDDSARDMIIGHELGHIRCGHLRWRWLLLPGLFVPFLGSAYSRACEHTCDRYGAALCGDRKGVLLGLSILAAGGVHGREVNAEALASQREHLNTGWMTIGKWLATHPTLSERIVAVVPALAGRPVRSARGPVFALTILATAFLVPLAGLVYAFSLMLPVLEQAAQSTPSVRPPSELSPRDIEIGQGIVQEDLLSLAAFAEDCRERSGQYPADGASLYRSWELERQRERVL